MTTVTTTTITCAVCVRYCGLLLHMERSTYRRGQWPRFRICSTAFIHTNAHKYTAAVSVSLIVHHSVARWFTFMEANVWLARVQWFAHSNPLTAALFWLRCGEYSGHSLPTAGLAFEWNECVRLPSPCCFDCWQLWGIFAISFLAS